MKLIVTAEHAGNKVPKEYAHFFTKNRSVLESHRAYDLGSLDLIEAIKPLAFISKYNMISRLLIEVNRSIHHNDLFSEFTNQMTISEKNKLLKTVYYRHRNPIEDSIKKLLLNNEQVLHISVHSFTPIFKNEIRKCDIGLLFDPQRVKEKELCKIFKTNLKIIQKDLNVRFNYPYLGKSDGFTTYLRNKFGHNYLGIEIEVNQKFVKNNLMYSLINKSISSALKMTIKA